MRAVAMGIAVAVLGVAGLAGTAGSITAGPAVVVPVVSCPAALGAQGPAAPGVPGGITATLPSGGDQLRFYSDGFVTLLAPSGWSCAGVEAADGGQSLSVFPAGQPDPLTAKQLRASAVGVTAILDHTGHGPGAQLVCGLFPGTRAARLAAATGGCARRPGREQVKRPRAGVVTFVDPPGVKGSGEPSGGRARAVGAARYPRRRPEPSSVNVAKVTCTLGSTLTALCPGIVEDFLARDATG
jgi:hypothetical protein